MHIWDSEKGEIQMPEIPEPSAFRISDDGSKVFITSSEGHGIQALSMWKWELVGEVKWEEKSGYFLGRFCAGG